MCALCFKEDAPRFETFHPIFRRELLMTPNLIDLSVYAFIRYCLTLAQKTRELIVKKMKFGSSVQLSIRFRFGLKLTVSAKLKSFDLGSWESSRKTVKIGHKREKKNDFNFFLKMSMEK